MEKFFLQSKTVAGILLTAFVALAPQFGLSFTNDDSALVSSLVDALIQAATLALALFGRFKATSTLKVKP